MITYAQKLWRNRNLLFELTNKELKARYKSAYRGFVWAFLNPLLQMVVLSVVFSLVLRINVPDYPLFLLSGLIPWTFFSLSVTAGTGSLINNRDLIKKIPFPREFLPISAVLAQFYNFLISLALLFVFLIVSLKLNLNWSLSLLLVAIILELVFILGFVLLTASLDIYYRDVGFIVSALVLVWFYLTPIFYPISFVPERFLSIYSLNPLVGITTLFQTSLLGGDLPSIKILLPSVIVPFFLLTLGYIIFNKREAYFADWV